MIIMDKYVIKYLEEEVEVLKPIPIKGFFTKMILNDKSNH